MRIGTPEIKLGIPHGNPNSRYFKVDLDLYEVAYFTLARAEDLRTRRWRDSPDASNARLGGLVNDEVEVLRQRDLAD